MDGVLEASSRPTWFEATAPLGSAVRYVASLSPQFHWVGIYLLKNNQLELGPFIGAETDHRIIPVGKGICGRAVAEGKDLNIPDVSVEENYLACSLETKSELVVLIRNQKSEIVGQIDIDSHEPDAFARELESSVRRVAEELGYLWQDLEKFSRL